MAPKDNNYALVFWVDEGTSTVVSCDIIKSQDRKEGKVAKVMLSDKSGKKMLHNCKIVKISRE